MSFEAPLTFLLLLVPFLARHLLPPRVLAYGAIRLPPSIVEQTVEASAFANRNRAERALPTLIWVCLVLALAGPRAMQTLDLKLASGRDIVLALDLSGSMEKRDFSLDGQQISRLDAVKRVASRFVESREGDRLGLIVFGDRAYVAAPLTHDTKSVMHSVNRSVIGISGKSTAISDGLGLALRRLRRSDAKSRVVILFSDGVDTTGTVAPDDVAAMAQDFGIRVHTIALGPVDLETNPTARDAVDAATLRLIADQSGGRMFRVRNLDELQAVTEAIEALEPSPSKAPPTRFWREYWVWPASAAFVLSLTALFLTRRETE